MNDQQQGPRKDLRTADILQIMQMVPHRYPFLLIDRVIEIVPGSHAVGIKNVSMNESFFQGHFPRQPIMPGVLIIESMAQTAAVLVVETLEGAAAGKLVYFMSIDDARFRKPVVPGDSIEIHVKALRNRGSIWKFSGDAKVEGRTVAEARFSAMIMDD